MKNFFLMLWNYFLVTLVLILIIAFSIVYSLCPYAMILFILLQVFGIISLSWYLLLIPVGLMVLVYFIFIFLAIVFNIEVKPYKKIKIKHTGYWN